MTLQYTYTKTPSSESIIVTGEFTRIIASTNPRFDAVWEYLRNTAEDELDSQTVLRLIDAGVIATDTLQKLSERVSYQDGVLYFDGDEVDTTLSNHIVRMIRSNDEDYGAFVAFLENVSQNPSKKSRKALFDFLQSRDFTITTDGHFIAYKGVRNASVGSGERSDKWFSLNSGTAYVNGEKVTGPIPNGIGDEISMPRSGVDPDRDSACSTGLHVGTRGYASSYAQGVMLIVAVNPRDVVMVPKHGNGHKMRVCRYKVLGTNESELTETTYHGDHRVEDEPEPERCTECGNDLDPDEDDVCFDCEGTNPWY